MGTLAAPTATIEAGHPAVVSARWPRRAVRWGLVAAISIGAFVGAMSCASGMAVGAGHDTHASVGPLRVDHAEGHVGHSSQAAAGDDASSTGSEEDSGSVAVAQGHPGMACVTSVRLRVPLLVAPGDVRPAGEQTALPPPDCVNEPEPPVPRVS